MWDGRIVTMNNNVLNGLTIVNVNRSPPMYDSHTVYVDVRTPMETLERLWAGLVDAMRARPNDFLPDKSRWTLMQVQNQNALQIEYCIGHATNFAKGQHYPRRHYLVGKLQELSLALNIGFYQPPQPLVRLADRPAHGLGAVYVSAPPGDATAPL